MGISRHLLARAGLLAIGLALAAPAPAQVQEIVVTARKREENLQDVPLSITALTGEQLQQLGATSDYDVANFSVNFLTLQQTGREFDRVTIRGQATPAVGGEPYGAYFIDGVYLASTVSTATLEVIDRVEILRGPQSAQLGRGTFSGAVNYITKTPSNEFEGSGSIRYGSNEDYKAGGWMMGPIIDDKLLFLVSANFESYGGQFRNTLQPGDASFEPYSLAGSPLGTNASQLTNLYTKEFPWAVYPQTPTTGCATLPVAAQAACLGYASQLGSDNSRMGNEQTSDFLGKFVYKPFDSTKIDFKYSYTKANDGAWVSLPFFTQNCYIPKASPNNTIPAGSPAWYYTQFDNTQQAMGGYCGEFSGQGLQNKVNLPEFLYGVPIYSPAVGQEGVIAAFSPPTKPGTRSATNRFLINLDQKIGDWQAIFRGAYDLYDREIAFDLDHTANLIIGNLFDIDSFIHQHDQSYEFRVSSPGDLPIRGEFGLYDFHVASKERQRSMPGPGGVINVQTGKYANVDGTPFQPAPPLSEGLVRKTSNYAMFGSLDWDFIERWTLALEARYGSDQKSIYVDGDESVIAQFRAADLYPITIKTKSFTPRVTLRWKFTDDAMVYLLAAKGNQPADFNDGYLRAVNTFGGNQPGTQIPFLNFISDPKYSANGKCALVFVCEQQAWTYELGVKTKWLDGRATVNADLFFIDWQDQAVYQIGSAPGNGSSSYFSIQQNEGSSRSAGLELETNYAVTDNFSLRANYSYTNAKFINASDSEVCRTTAQGVQFYSNPYDYDNPQANVVSPGNAPTKYYRCVGNNVGGNFTPNTPEHTIILGANLTRPIGNGRTVFLRADQSFISRRYIQAGNFNWVGNRDLLNLSFGMQTPGGWTFTGYVKNLLNDQTPQAVLNFVDFGNPYPRNAAGQTQTIPTINFNPTFGNVAVYAPATYYSLNPTRGRDIGVTVNYKF